MLNHHTQVHSFLTYLNAPASDALVEALHTFIDHRLISPKREVIFDRGQLMFIENGKQMASHTLESNNDRVVKFDGQHIQEINPYAYLNTTDYQMKGDNASSGRRSSGNSSSGIGSNNNNNNNNNNNG
ncbi:hypothetical protein [Pelagibaculum spongiae]|uniref:Uncharacterized protein n=1 Tax=Pelagibaculum spongiae TaxID=2080658 RepID=A0A2V1GXU1_9GAMM|nr:hypothetical protein [Pelagibaculum spongiae]PVZ66756.1 hypothetical protein DC094_15950 [Pelagibaculum spongiae]